MDERTSVGLCDTGGVENRLQFPYPYIQKYSIDIQTLDEIITAYVYEDKNDLVYKLIRPHYVIEWRRSGKILGFSRRLLVSYFEKRKSMPFFPVFAVQLKK